MNGIKGAYKGFEYVCASKEAEQKLKNYIDSLGNNPTEIPDASEENYAEWRCDYDFEGVDSIKLPECIRRIGKCAFAQSKIKNIVAEGVLMVDELAFYGTRELNFCSLPNCTKLVAIDSETGEETTGSDAFNHSAVSILDLPKVEVVGRYCFYDMPNIIILRLPSVEQMEPYAVYGCERLEIVDISKLQSAKFSIITNNPQLAIVGVANGLVADKLSLHSNSTRCRVIDSNTGKNANIYYVNAQNGNEQHNEALSIDELNEPEVFEYEYEMFGFRFSLVDGLTDEQKQVALSQLAGLFEYCQRSGEIPNSRNKDKNESGHKELRYVKDIFVPDNITTIGDYAFAKCYGIQSIVAPGVKTVCDHAFYCDENLRYIQIDSCETLEHDAFNGAGAAVDAAENPKLFAKKVTHVGAHAFWQTGFVIINLPNATNIETSAIEENENLKCVIVCELKNDYSLNMNKALANIKYEKCSANMAWYGCPFSEIKISEKK